MQAGHRTFFSYLWQSQRKLFWLLLLLAIGHLAPVAAGFELCSPFYYWGMYSYPQPRQDSLFVYTLRYNRNETFALPHTGQDFRRMMYTYSISFYDALLQTGDTLPVGTRSANALTKVFAANPYALSLHNTGAAVKAYPAWLDRWLARATGEKIDSLRVVKTAVRYSSGGTLQILNAQTLLRYP